MNLYINSPAYYTQNHGIIDDIYKMCSLITQNVDIKLYTNGLDTIGITPIIAPEKDLNYGKWREVKVVNLSLRIANISLVSNYDAFRDGDIFEKKTIILKNILNSLKVIEKKMKGQFNYNGIERDIRELLNSNTVI